MTVHQRLIMPRFRRGQIHSIKHIVDADGTLDMVGTTVGIPIGTTVDAPSAVFNPAEVTLGETVKAIFLSIFVIGASGAGIGAPINWYIIKLRAGQTQVNPGETGVSQIRNQIFHEEKGMAGSIDGTPMAFKGVVRVPPGMQRMRSGDVFQIAFNLESTASGDANFCVKAIYKSFS